MNSIANDFEYVFGYGSLVDVDALSRFLRRKVRPHEVEYAELPEYRRTWNVAMDNRLDLPGYKYYVDAATGSRPEIYVAFLNVYASLNSRVNGMAICVRRDELARFDRRERNYRRCALHAEFRGGARVPVWVYVGTGEAEKRFQHGLANANVCLGADYFNSVVNAFSELGSEALLQFARSTDSPAVPIRTLRQMKISTTIACDLPTPEAPG